jgi:imidazoleglycerol-phosphate dehydratase
MGPVTIRHTSVETGIPVLDELFTVLAQHANLTLNILCTGDLWVDDHHTAEDVSIAVGQCLTQALGTKAGLNRMWLAKAEHGSMLL